MQRFSSFHNQPVALEPSHEQVDVPMHVSFWPKTIDPLKPGTHIDEEAGGHVAFPPILRNKHYDTPSVFTPENLLKGARRQKGLLVGSVPEICILDPDGDLVDYLRANQLSRRHVDWACYHTTLDIFTYEGVEYGIIGRTVGGAFAVMVAEELFASGCQLLISVLSAGQMAPVATPPPYVVLIDRALRDEGTSYHYLPPSHFCDLSPTLKTPLLTHWDPQAVPLYVGASWTTDAPFRETPAMIDFCRAHGILAVEMEAAALYAMAQARQSEVICFAIVTNQLGHAERDFEKGDCLGCYTALALLAQTTQRWHAMHR